ATGNLVNTATVTPPAGVTDPTPGNNSATDTDTPAAQADLSITKTDGKTTAVAGTSNTYTVVVSNAGPTAVIGATVTETFPAAMSPASWTAVGAGGATGFTAAANNQAGINDTVTMPVGSTNTYTLPGAITITATGTLINTATVTVPAG